LAKKYRIGWKNFEKCKLKEILVEKCIFFRSLSILSVSWVFGSWNGARRGGGLSQQLSFHENVPILTRINESLTSAETKRNVLLQSNTEKQMRFKNGGLCRTKKYIFINRTKLHMQLFRRITTKFVKIIKVPRPKLMSVSVIMFPNYHCITASVSKMCETFT
jgi:hypothetical protein